MTTATLGSLEPDELRRRLAHGRLWLCTPPFTLRLQSRLPAVLDGLLTAYADYPLAEPGLAEFHLAIRRAPGPSGWLHGEVIFDADGRIPFAPLPAAQGFAMLEWGLNWCISNQMHRYLIIHAAVLALGDAGVVLCGEPGAGKSTLAAALMHEGWRLLSDELTLVDAQCRLQPVPRPVSLKNDSIGLIRRRYPAAVLTRTARDTTKGSVAHVKVCRESLDQAERTAVPRAVVFPRYRADSPLRLEEIPRGEALMRLIEGAFNYHLLGREGFERTADLIERSTCMELEYSGLDEALPVLRALVEGGG